MPLPGASKVRANPTTSRPSLVVTGISAFKHPRTASGSSTGSGGEVPRLEPLNRSGIATSRRKMIADSISRQPPLSLSPLFGADDCRPNFGPDDAKERLLPDEEDRETDPKLRREQEEVNLELRKLILL